MPPLGALYERLAQCSCRDARRLHVRLREMGRRGRRSSAPSGTVSGQSMREPASGEAARIAADIERSAARVEARRRSVPPIVYPSDLPVAGRREEIMAAVREHQVVVVCGATGSGKTTQLPKMLLELGRGARGWIGHTQPRRIAARSVAARIAHELGTAVGSLVGYKVRFTDQTSERSLVKVMTDGLLLAETQGDRYLSAYDTIIIDEAHERSLNIDFLLGYLRQLLVRRPDLKVVITSATIDPQRFAAHFSLPGKPPVPIIEVSGRTYPVEVRYRPLDAQHPDEEDLEEEQGIVRAVDELTAESGGAGDILVFLPGEREIRETAEALRKHHLKNTEVIPLFARLSADEQQRIFESHAHRRIILATNVAETSLTVPGIRYVIDSGVARISRYSPRVKVQRLPIEPISKASADQRAGRCGRTGPGVCIRLYSQEDFDKRAEFTDPEILRTNLASVILQMKALDLGEIEHFPFIQAPDARNIRDGYDTLLEIGALEGGGLRNELTAIGRHLARLPIDPRVGRMILAADSERCLADVLVIAAALSTQDPRERPIDRQEAADAAHAQFREEGSDFLGFLRLWRELHREQKRLSGNQFRRWCRERFISYLRFREWHDTQAQLHTLMTDMGFVVTDRPAKGDNIHRALLTGLLSSIGRKSDRNAREAAGGEGDYDGARGIRFSIFPGSTLFRKAGHGRGEKEGERDQSGAPGSGRGAKWVMAAEIVKTTRTYARTVAAIQPQWIEPIAQHLVKRTYAEPHWVPELAQVCAFETVTLYGLEIVKRRRVNYGGVEPTLSRTLFIHHALVNGEYMTSAPFFEHNHALAGRLKHMQEKARSTDLLADNAARFAFYDKRLPTGVSSGPEFEHWRRKAEAREPRLLVMRKEDVLAPGAVEPPPEQFPESIRVGGRDLLLEYKHEPGHVDDGITLVMPADLLAEFPSHRPDWLVPGYMQEKIAGLIRELPKALRAALTPVPQTAAAVAARLCGKEFASRDFLDALSSAATQVTGRHVPRGEWAQDRLPPHLRMNLRVVDEKGRVLATGRDLAQIRRSLAGQRESTLFRLPEGPFNRAAGAGVFLWEIGEAVGKGEALPESIEVRHDGRVLTLFPALHDEGSSTEVAIRPFTTAARARQAHAIGLQKLFYLHTRRECASLIRTMPGIERLALLARALPGQSVKGSIEGGVLLDQLAQLTANRAWTADGAADGAVDSIRTREAFEARLNQRWTRIGAAGGEVVALAEQILTGWSAVAPVLENADSCPPSWGAAIADIRTQVAYLFTPGFWTATPFQWLRQYPRYMVALRRRLEKLSAMDGAARDTALLNTLAPFWLRLRIRAEQGTADDRADAELILFRWMIEEFRCSLFAQDQRTAVPVSARRLEQQWEKIVRSPG